MIPSSPSMLAARSSRALVSVQRLRQAHGPHEALAICSGEFIRSFDSVDLAVKELKVESWGHQNEHTLMTQRQRQLGRSEDASSRTTFVTRAIEKRTHPRAEYLRSLDHRQGPTDHVSARLPRRPRRRFESADDDQRYSDTQCHGRATGPQTMRVARDRGAA
ncbi:hypothetical protein EW146_g553 [Bondarzewia mesenterica]|uniref:Uncharacterized protein n=1 Tax=Bondarzewia mesenterica TaxID=1095465 RepID=A0A4S4MCV4_9AGAM|nr:hypothetical protein EW146_g553 [Bondarzewia mesenterica]